VAFGDVLEFVLEGEGFLDEEFEEVAVEEEEVGGVEGVGYAEEVYYLVTLLKVHTILLILLLL